MELGKTIFKLVSACKNSNKSNYEAYRKVDAMIDGTQVSEKLVVVAVETVEYISILESDYDKVIDSNKLSELALSKTTAKKTWSKARVATNKDPLLEEEGYAVKMKAVLDGANPIKLEDRLSDIAAEKVAAAANTAKAVDPMVLLEALMQDPQYAAAMELLMKK